MPDETPHPKALPGCPGPPEVSPPCHLAFMEMTVRFWRCHHCNAFGRVGDDGALIYKRELVARNDDA